MVNSAPAQPKFVELKEVRRPLCVDLDNTLLRSDSLWEAFVRVAKNRPSAISQLPRLLGRGKLAAKVFLHEQAALDPALLPYNQDVIKQIHFGIQQGRRIVMITGSPIGFATKVAEHLGLFEEVIASGEINMVGREKVLALNRRFGVKAWDYIGDDSNPVVFEAAASGISLAGTTPPSHIEHHPLNNSRLASTMRALRPHQWVKNLLILVPMFAAHQYTSALIWLQGILAFVAFSTAASAAYVLNDLLDLDDDRQHPQKRNRPFASAALSIPFGLTLVPFIWLQSILAASTLPWTFVLLLSSYVVLTNLYSFWLKRIAVVDTFSLAALYTLRVAAGAAATGIRMSFWIFALSLFLFYSLGSLKRLIELRTRSRARGYSSDDIIVLIASGLASAYAAVLVMGLYANSEAAVLLYRKPDILWAACPPLFFWLTSLWHRGNRGLMHHDPVVYAVRDPMSQACGILCISAFIFAR